MSDWNVPEVLTLEEIGLYHVLERIYTSRGSVDEFVRLGLVRSGLILDANPLQLTDAGRERLRYLTHKLQPANEG